MKKVGFGILVFIFSALIVPHFPSGFGEAAEINENGEVIERVKNGTINWTIRKIEAIGLADSDQPVYGQVKAAQIAARAELLTVLKGIRIRGSYGVLQGLLKKDISEVDLEGFLSNSYVTRPKPNESGLIEAKAFVFLDERGNTLLMPENAISGNDKASWVPSRSLTPSLIPYTGLIIDARGLGLEPAMAPRILVEGENLELYGSRIVDKEVSFSNGFAAYAGSLEKARTLKDRIGENPLIIKGLKRSHVSDVVISAEDAIAVARALKSFNFLKECKVVIVLD